MVATRSRVGVPQAFLSLPYLLSHYLFWGNTGKTITNYRSLCALDIGKLIPKPLRFRERDPLPTVRTSPHTPVVIPNKHPPVKRRSSLAFEQTLGA